MILPVRLLSRGCPRSLICCIRKESSYFAENAGIVQPQPPSSFISEKLTEISETNEVVDTVSENAVSYFKDNITDVLQPVMELPVLAPYLTTETVWIPLVAGAAILRTCYTAATRLSAYRALQKSVPHTKVFTDISVKLLNAKRRNDKQAITRLKQDRKNYMKDNGGVVDPNQYKVIGMFSSVALASFYLSTLSVFSHLGSDFLSHSSFFWIPNLAQPDPYYVLPLVNTVLSLSVLALDPLPPKPSNLQKSKGGQGLRSVHPIVWVVLTPVVYKWLSLMCHALPSHIALFWCTSNLAALSILLPLRYSGFLRRSVGVMPYPEYRKLVQQENISIAEIKEREHLLEKEEKLNEN